MQTVHVAREMRADPAAVFALVSDPANYARLPGVRRARLRRAGDETTHGVGAERELQLPGMTIVEQITHYQAKHSLGYRIIDWPLPLTHLGARFLLQPAGEHGDTTRVNWTTRIRAQTRLAKVPVEAAAARQIDWIYRLWLRRFARVLDGL